MTKPSDVVIKLCDSVLRPLFLFKTLIMSYLTRMTNSKKKNTKKAKPC